MTTTTPRGRWDDTPRLTREQFMERQNDWMKITRQLPKEGVLVMTKIDNEKGARNECYLVRRGRLWFVNESGDAMYVYYTPTHWRAL